MGPMGFLPAYTTHMATQLGTLIAELRKAKGWTQERLAGLAGVSHSTISRLERGGTKAPREVELGRIADALGTTVEALTHGAMTRPMPSMDDPLLERLRRTFPPGDADVLTDWLEETADYAPEDKRFTVQMVEWLRKVMTSAREHRGAGVGQNTPPSLAWK